MIRAGIVLLNGMNPNGNISKTEPVKIKKLLILLAILLFVRMLNRWGLLIFSKK
jgi:hypothetical protein